jgi:hypothetical protein
MALACGDGSVVSGGAVVSRWLLALTVLLGLANSAAAEIFPTCRGSSIALDTSADRAPFVNIRLGNRSGNFLVDTGTSFSAVDSRVFGLKSGTSVTLAGSTFPTVAAARVRVLDLHGHPAPPGGFAGIIGNDLLRERLVAFRYDQTPATLTILAQPCSWQTMTAAGFVPISLGGYDAQRARRVRAIWAGQPALFVRIGGVAAPVGLDSGFSELAPTPRAGTLQVNEAFLARLQEAGVAMTPGKPRRDIDCRGESVERAVWQVEEASLAFTSESGKEIFRYQPPTLEVLPRARGCGRIEAAAEPFGLVGAAYLQVWGTVIVDGRNEQVWLSPQQARALYRAMAVAWNRDGAWEARTDVTVAAANDGALATCNRRHGGCTLAGAAIDPARYQCVAIARGTGAVRKLTMIAGGSIIEARQGAIAACTAAQGAPCRIEYAACND